MYQISALDLRSGYYNISLIPEGKPKPAFATACGKWHWNVAPFGICSLPGVFCYIMSQVLSALDFCFVYLDDIIVYSSSWKENLQHLEVVFKHLKKANLKIKLSKCQFVKRHLHYLGQLISEHGIQLILEEASAIKRLKEPSNIDELHDFLSLTGYYRKFIPLFTDITKLLNKFLKKDTKFQ